MDPTDSAARAADAERRWAVIYFIFGVAAVFAGLMGASLGLEETYRWYERGDVVQLIARSVAAPVLSAWLLAEIIKTLRPLRLFERRIARIVPRFLTGVVAGVIGAAIGSFALVVVDGFAHEVVILGAAGAVGSCAMLLPLRRVRCGECVHCRYDLQNQPPPGQHGWGICPECGNPVQSHRAAAA